MRLYPPSYLLIGILSMVGLHAWFPGRQIFSQFFCLLGIPVGCLGIGIVLWCARLFRIHQTAIKPFEESTTLVSTSLYQYSRNPIYIGMVVLLMGVAILLGSLSPWFVVPMFVWAIDRQFVVAEEAVLMQKFGVRYSEYCKKVRRWL